MTSAFYVPEEGDIRDIRGGGQEVYDGEVWVELPSPLEALRRLESAEDAIWLLSVKNADLVEELEMRDRQFAATQQHLLKTAEALSDLARELRITPARFREERALDKAANAIKRAAETQKKPKGKLPR